MDNKLKYVRLKRFNEIVIFPDLVEHSDFRNLNLISAGFCSIDSRNMEVQCYGKSVSLGLESSPEADSYWATKWVFGQEAADDMMERKKEK